MGEARDNAEAQWWLEAMGFDTRDTCFIPECGCVGQAHE
jgi:hypothetical protein